MATASRVWQEIPAEKIIGLFGEPMHPHDLFDPLRIADELGITVDLLPVVEVMADYECGQRLNMNGKRLFYMSAVAGGDLIDAIAAGLGITSPIDASGNYRAQRVARAAEIVRRLKAS